MTLRDAIRTWVTGPFLSEAQCRDSLARHLQACFPKNKIEVEFRIGMQIADIFIDFKNWAGDGAKVVVELKYDLQEMNEFNRLVGQIGGYVKSGAAVVVLLCGETKPELAQCVLTRLNTFKAEKFFRKGHVLTTSLTIRGPDGRFVAAGSGAPDRNNRIGAATA